MFYTWNAFIWIRCYRKAVCILIHTPIWPLRDSFLVVLKQKVLYRLPGKQSSLLSDQTYRSYVEISEVYPQVLQIEIVCAFLVLSCGQCGGLTLVCCQTSTQPISYTQLFSHYLSSTGQRNKIKKLMVKIKKAVQGDREWRLHSVHNSSSLPLLPPPEVTKFTNCTKAVINSFSLNNVNFFDFVPNVGFWCFGFFFFRSPGSYSKSLSFYKNLTTYQEKKCITSLDLQTDFRCLCG